MTRKKVLVIGKNGFIGSALAKWLKDQGFEVLQASGHNREWRDFSMEGIDTVVYAADLAHVREKKRNEALFYRAHTWRAEEAAGYAKQHGIRQFLYISSMKVYGSTGKQIHTGTPVKPDSIYGRSKRLGELKVLELEEESFAVAILRPPLVCGPGCRGSIRLLLTASKFIKFFPSYPNCRSIVDIINLCILIEGLIEGRERGIYHPQNQEQLSSWQLISLMAYHRGRKIIPLGIFNPMISWMLPRVRSIRKIFGDDCYDHELSEYTNLPYDNRSSDETVRNMIESMEKRP